MEVQDYPEISKESVKEGKLPLPSTVKPIDLDPSALKVQSVEAMMGGEGLVDPGTGEAPVYFEPDKYLPPLSKTYGALSPMDRLDPGLGLPLPATPPSGVLPGNEPPLPPSDPNSVAQNKGGASPIPVMLTNEDKKKNESRVDYGNTDAMTTAQGKVQEAMRASKKIFEDLSNDKEFTQALTRQVAMSQHLVDLTDPNSEAFKAYHSAFTTTAANLDKAQMDLIEFQKKSKIDPQRYTKSQSSLANAMDSIAVFYEGRANAYGSALGHAPSHFIQDRIDAAIQQDILRQKEEMSGQQTGLTNEVNRYRDNLKLLGDERLATIKTTQEGLISANNYLNALKDQKTGIPLAQNAIEKQIAENQLQFEKLKLEMTKRAITEEMDQKFAPLNYSKGMSVEQANLEDRRVREKDERTVPFGDFKLSAYAVEGETGAKTLNTNVSDTKEMIANINAMKALRASSWPLGTVLPSEDLARAQSLSTMILLKAKSTNNLGVLSDSDRKLLETMIPDARGWDWIFGKLEQLESASINTLANRLGQGVKEGQALDVDRVGKIVKDLAKPQTEYLLNIPKHSKSK